MIFYSITNIPDFLGCVSKCTGDVAFIDSNGELQDLKQLAKQSASVLGLLQSGCLRNLDVRVGKAEDRMRLMRYMHEMRV